MSFPMQNIFFILGLSFLLTIFFMPIVIRYFREKQLGQMTREEGPSWHEAKSGTPTMGGVVFLVTASVVSIGFASVLGVLSIPLGLTLFILLLYGLLGFLDDYIKLIMKRNLGLTSKEKLAGQVAGAFLFFVIYKWSGFSTELFFPVVGTIQSDWLFGLFTVFWLVGFSNAVNLTDGLDGLVAGTGTLAFSAYALIALNQGQWDLAVLTLAVIGGLLGFFLFNKKPAKIFMGDVGSLALGGGLAALSIFLKREFSLLLIGIIFVVETASVIIQVISFKLTGKRVFKMSPIHHHFEMSGWSEWKVVLVFWLVGLLGAVATLLLIQ